ncbi:MAG: ABC transporter ATP-binding protein [Armatimonadetes bacterium]|nr:ABC transporter ATP-binding protein [Armatimonadota bacterium]
MTDARSGDAVVCRALSRTFGSVKAVDGLDLTVGAGQIYGLLGPDGAGKTTTMRMLTAIMPPTSGTAAILGHDVMREPEAIKARIGYMSQRFSLYGDLTVEENLVFSADLFQVPSAERAERTARLLRAARLEGCLGRRAQDLSGGMKQKLALACALIHKPRVLFLDEPTTGVDPLSRREFWRLLSGLVAEGVTLVVSTPYMDEASRCTCLALMHRGRLLAVGSPAQVVAGMRGAVVIVEAPDLRAARRELRRLPWASSVEAFGEALHVVTDRPGREAEIARALREAGIDATRVEAHSPDLEDAFVELMRRERHDA